VEKVEERLFEMTRDLVDELGFVLVDIDEVTEQGRRTFRFYIDHREGVSLDDCASVSRELSYFLDGEQEPEGSYVLEVSSPGLDHRLRKTREYAHFAGRTARLVLRSEAGERNVVTGEILGADEGGVRIRDDRGQELSIELADIARARLVV
jgi:ribosome maturation factor RimP